MLVEPGDEQLIADAVAQARAAGVREAVIAAVLREEAGHGDVLSASCAAGRLGTLARMAQQPDDPYDAA